MPPIPPPAASGFTTTTPVPLWWAAYGPEDAATLLVVHGGPGAHHDYLLPQMLRLAERWRCIFWDQRGGGKSKTDDREPIGWRTHVADMALVARELAGDGPHAAVGYSWGGMLAMLYALEASRDAALPPLASLALIDPAPISRQYRERFEAEFARRQAGEGVRRLREELAASGLRERDPDAYRQRAFELSVAGYFARPEAARDLTPFRVTGRVQQSTWESLGDFDLARDLSALQLPALVIHGRQDPIPLASSEAAARALGAELVVLDDCGHVPYVEQPDALFAALVPFLERTVPAAR